MLDGGEWSKSHPHDALLLERTLVPVKQPDVWASEPAWTVLEKRKLLSPVGILTPDCPARSKYQYRLRHPGRICTSTRHISFNGADVDKLHRLQSYFSR